VRKRCRRRQGARRDFNKLPFYPERDVMNKLSLNIKVLATIFVACVTCTVAAIVVSRMEISSIARDDLAEKSRAILSRLEVAREYIANMDIMETMIKETVKDHPDGKVPKDQQVRILKGVPIFASFKLGEKGSEIEHYKFRIFSPAARNKENTATPEELGLLRRSSPNRSRSW
jgi:methyl-accepting chemotaxis protein